MLRTFNVDENVYKTFRAECKELGVSMSKQVERFMQQFTEARPEYLRKLEKLRKGPFTRYEDFDAWYGAMNATRRSRKSR